MAINNYTIDKSENLSIRKEDKRDIYISYNSLSQKGEVKSVSKAMREYIKDGFAKFSSKNAQVYFFVSDEEPFLLKYTNPF